MIRQSWQVVGGNVRVAVDEAEWWGASLGVLIAAVHHPGVLAGTQPATDPADVAYKVLAEVAELYAAAAIALGESEAEATIRSGIRAGTAVPRRAPESPAWRPPGARAAMPRPGSPSPTQLRRREGVPDVHPAR